MNVTGPPRRLIRFNCLSRDRMGDHTTPLPIRYRYFPEFHNIKDPDVAAIRHRLTRTLTKKPLDSDGRFHYGSECLVREQPAARPPAPICCSRSCSTYPTIYLPRIGVPAQRNVKRRPEQINGAGYCPEWRIRRPRMLTSHGLSHGGSWTGRRAERRVVPRVFV